MWGNAILASTLSSVPAPAVERLLRASQESSGVVDKDFKVNGTNALRVVNASVSPRILGFFIVSAVYMIAEKAADSIPADSGRNRSARYGI